MEDNEKLIFINDNGDSIVFHNNSVFIATNIEGLDTISNEIVTTRNFGQDGATYHSSNLQSRNVILQGYIIENPAYNKELMIKVFNPKLSAKLVYEKDNESKYINCRIEQTPKFKNDAFTEFLIQIVAPNPYLLDNNVDSEEITTWIGGLNLPFTLPFNLRSKGETKKVICNKGHVETPIEVVFNGPGVNPCISNLTTGEFIRVNRELAAGDMLYINTDYDNTEILIEKLDGKVEEATHYIDLDTTFFYLKTGDNIIEYSTDSLELQGVKIRYQNRYLGV